MADTKAIRFPSREQGNQWAPLPPDYPDLSEHGQRLARVNACCLQVTPDDLVAAWSLFRRVYLFPSGVELGLYGSDLTESPPFHYDFIRSVGQYAFNAWACPRGFGKSTLVDELILLISLTRPAFPTGLCLASDKLVNDRFELYQTQFTNNERLIEDFGAMRPNRGEGSWNQHVLTLNNGSRVRGFAVLGRKRGIKPRPRLLFLDDPEYDPTGATDMLKLREDFDWLFFRVLMRMGQKGMAMCWPGTIITKQGSLWRALCTDDPRFARWNRVILAAETAGADGDMKALWPQLWDLDTLAAMKQDMGAAAYGAEMLNRPGSGTERTFPLDPVRHGYVVEGDTGGSPLLSAAPVRYHERPKSSDELVERTGAWGDMVAKMYRMMMVDYASTVGPQSDFSSIIVVGFQRPQDVLWGLDAFVAKVKDTVLIRKIWDLGIRWRVQVIGIESFSIQQTLVDSAATFMQETAEKLAAGWVPRVLPIKRPYGMSKQDGIAGMQWRFTSDRIKLPFTREREKGWAILFQQLRDFQAEARDGNLMHDDAVDALSMYQLIKRSRGVASPDNQPRSISGPLDALEQGKEDYLKTGVHPGLGVNAEEVGPALLRALARRMETEQTRQRDLSITRR